MGIVEDTLRNIFIPWKENIFLVTRLFVVVGYSIIAIIVEVVFGIRQITSNIYNVRNKVSVKIRKGHTLGSKVID